MISVVVDDQEADVGEVRKSLATCLREMGVRPRFRTVVAWLVDQTEAMKSQPTPHPVQRGVEAEHRGTAKRRRLGHGPAA